MELLPLSVGIGRVVSLLFSELCGLAAGGMVVPGYLALYLSHPLQIALTVGAGLITYALGAALESFLIVYGRRRTVVMILLGYLVGMTLRTLTQGYVGPDGGPLDVVGFIIPGLIAIWLARQGVVETLASLLTASAVVRLVLITVTGAEIGP
jgi:poly-gamma-glutamate biosynthesis protein PgsC/CapC